MSEKYNLVLDLPILTFIIFSMSERLYSDPKSSRESKDSMDVTIVGRLESIGLLNGLDHFPAFKLRLAGSNTQPRQDCLRCLIWRALLVAMCKLPIRTSRIGALTSARMSVLTSTKYVSD